MSGREVRLPLLGWLDEAPSGCSPPGLSFEDEGIVSPGPSLKLTMRRRLCLRRLVGKLCDPGFRPLPVTLILFTVPLVDGRYAGEEGS